MKNLEKLEKEIRLKLPRLMELGEGCIVKDKYGDFEKILHHYESNLVITIDSIGYVSCVKIISKEDTIIGHEIKLNDVLEWLCMRGNYSCNMQNNRFYIYGIEVNLSKNLLKDQSQELIDSLFRLIPN